MVKHTMVHCAGIGGQYIAICQCGEEFKADWLSDLLFVHRSHRMAATDVDNTNVISIYTRKPLMV
jgi:hypothetical protein